MTKTSKRKLIVTSALVLGAVATVGATFGALILNGGTKTDSDGLGIGTVEIKNQVVSLDVNVSESAIVLDGNEEGDSYNADDLLHADVENDRQFSLTFTVKGDPDAWKSLSVSFAWDEGKDAADKYLELPAADTIEKSVAQASGAGSEAVWTYSKAYTISWDATTYSGGILKYINDKYNTTKDHTSALADLTAFKTDIESSRLTATVNVNL